MKEALRNLENGSDPICVEPGSIRDFGGGLLVGDLVYAKDEEPVSLAAFTARWILYHEARGE